jgi:peptidoglycan/LPS O-acetylase OafA/YrhL
LSRSVGLGLGYGEEPDLNYIAGLNGLRALAVIAVVWHHSPVSKPFPILKNGFLGVDIFFVLSGYLITSLLLHEQEKFGSVSLKQFYARRTLRIFPLYYAVLAVLALYHWHQGDLQFIAELPYHFTYTSNWVEVGDWMAIGWSLSTEEQFYLVWPVLFVLFARRYSLLILLLFLLVNQAVNFGLLDRWIPYGSLSILQTTFTPIIAGVLLAFFLHKHADHVRRVPPWLIAMSAGCLMLIAASSTDMRGLPRLAFHMATTAFLASLVLGPGMALVRILEWRPIAYIGTVSYGVYLLHMIGMHFASKIPGNWDFVVGFSITLAMAAFSYTFFERPLLRLKDRYRRSGNVG